MPSPSQLAQAHGHALLHLAQPRLNIASCLHTTAPVYGFAKMHTRDMHGFEHHSAKEVRLLQLSCLAVQEVHAFWQQCVQFSWELSVFVFRKLCPVMPVAPCSMQAVRQTTLRVLPRGTFSPSAETMARISGLLGSSPPNSSRRMPSKHLPKCGWTAWGLLLWKQQMSCQ